MLDPEKLSQIGVPFRRVGEQSLNPMEQT